MVFASVGPASPACISDNAPERRRVATAPRARGDVGTGRRPQQPSSPRGWP